MFDRRRWAEHGRALALGFVVAFLALSLAGYDPADPPGRAAEPVNKPPRNLCGPVGASLAHGLIVGVGRASYVLVFALTVAALLAFRRRVVAEPALRLLGLGMVVVVASALSQAFDPAHPPMSPIGSGGYVGAATSGFLGEQFGPVGMLLILSAMGFVGVGLCYDVLLVWPFEELSTLVRARRPIAPALTPSSRAGPS